jgi:hypothetical protein
MNLAGPKAGVWIVLDLAPEAVVAQVSDPTEDLSQAAVTMRRCWDQGSADDRIHDGAAIALLDRCVAEDAVLTRASVHLVSGVAEPRPQGSPRNSVAMLILVAHDLVVAHHFLLRHRRCLLGRGLVRPPGFLQVYLARPALLHAQSVPLLLRLKRDIFSRPRLPL